MYIFWNLCKKAVSETYGIGGVRCSHFGAQSWKFNNARDGAMQKKSLCVCVC